MSSTKPLSHQGTLIDEIKVIFKEGKIIEAKANKGEEVLKKVLDIDDGANFIGSYLDSPTIHFKNNIGTFY